MRCWFFRSLFGIYFILLPALLLLFSCRKNEIEIQFIQISSGTSADLLKIKRLKANEIYLCGGKDSSGFISKSTDEGNSWLLLQNNFPGKIYDMDVIDTGKMIAVSEKIVFYRTADDWKGWEYITPARNEYPETGYDSDLTSVDMINDMMGYACGGKIYRQGVLYRTWDGGTTWQFTYKEHEMKSVVMLDAQSGYASGYGVIYHTNDYGATWNITNAADDFFTCMSKSSPEHVFAAGYNGSIADTYKNGKWSTKEKGNKAFGERVHFRCIDFFNNMVGAAAGANGVIFITRDGGYIWEKGTAFDRAQINSILLISENSGLAAGENGKLFKFQF